MLKVTGSLVYLLLSVFAVVAWAGTPLERPNILLLLADDLGVNDTALYQEFFNTQPVTAMPSLEGLAKQGVLFTRFYTESTCSTSRAALLTGQYPARNAFMPVARGLSSDLMTLPKYLQLQGYRTHHVGKWHLGEINEAAKPWHQGFDSSFGFLNQQMLQGPDGQGNIQLKVPTYRNPWLVNQQGQQPAKTQQHEGHLEDILTEKTLTLINDKHAKQQPWFIYHAFFAPHTPLQPAARYKKPNQTQAEKYQALLKQLDENLNKIITVLKLSGQWNNTIVIFASDNGATGKRVESNAPFKGGKASYEEGGIRAPLVVKWHKEYELQENIWPASVRSNVTSIMDIYPSLKIVIDGFQEVAADNDMNFDGTPSLLNNDTRPSPKVFLSFDSLSIFNDRFNRRLIKSWNGGRFGVEKLLSYLNTGIHQIEKKYFWNKWFSNSSVQSVLWAEFLQWRDKVRQIPVTIERTNDSTFNYKVTGRDFLRTPINPYFSVLLKFYLKNVEDKQILLSQKNIIELFVEGGVLQGNIHGIHVSTKNIKVDQCYQVVLSGEFYDKYSTVQKYIMPSRLHLIVNGKEMDVASQELYSLEHVDISEPTYAISPPQFFSTQLLPNDKPIPSGLEDVLRVKKCF